MFTFFDMSQGLICTTATVFRNTSKYSIPRRQVGADYATTAKLSLS